MAANGWFATGMIRFARSRPESARSKCKSRRPAIAPPLRGSAFASRRTSCPNGRGAPRASRLCVSLSARDFGGRFPGDPRRLARQGRAQPLRGGDRPPQERVGGRISAMAEARFVGAPLRLRLGGRRLFAGAHEAAGRMHARFDGGDAGRQEGTDRLSDGRAGERSKLERAARRLESAQAVDRAGSRGRRRRARFLEGARRGVPYHPSPTMLAAQDIERTRQVPEVAAAQSAQGSARDLVVARPGLGGSGNGDLRRK